MLRSYGLNLVPFTYRLMHILNPSRESVTPFAILEREAPETILKRIDDAVKERFPGAATLLGAVLTYDVAQTWLGENGWILIHDYCKERLEEDVVSPILLFDVLLEQFQPGAGAGVWLGDNVTASLDPKLEFDGDGLLTGPIDHIVYTKEGVLTPDYFLLYERSIPGAGLTGGFVEALLVSRSQQNPDRFGLAVRTDIVLSRAYHRETHTRAFIRGPRGLGIEKLQDSKFPEDPRGTVTEHRPVEGSRAQRLFPLERLEVMWSRRKGLKTVQFEELVAPRRKHCSGAGLIRNRYAHAVWDPGEMHFQHFDGALRGYSAKQYQGRLTTDLKKYTQKSDEYQKLFRIDGALRLDEWCDLLTRYYDQNELVLEYLGGPREDRDWT